PTPAGMRRHGTRIRPSPRCFGFLSASISHEHPAEATRRARSGREGASLTRDLSHTRRDEMATKRPTEKKGDLPPEGRRNPAPITDAPGAHPIETGIGAAVAGAASGLAAGAVAGPAGAAIGAAVGAVAGGLAGKGVGELIDPTTEDDRLRENFE